MIFWLVVKFQSKRRRSVTPFSLSERSTWLEISAAIYICVRKAQKETESSWLLNNRPLSLSIEIDTEDFYFLWNRNRNWNWKSKNSLSLHKNTVVRERKRGKGKAAAAFALIKRGPDRAGPERAQERESGIRAVGIHRTNESMTVD